MRRMILRLVLGLFISSLAGVELLAQNSQTVDSDQASIPPDTLVMVVMDPLAGPLACDCVKGYAQRKYEILAKHLEQATSRKIKVLWAGALKTALAESEQRADIVIGKHSVVLSDSKLANMKMVPVAQLTGKDGGTTQSGLVVVRQKDSAQSISDLAGYQILFGTEDCEEKYAAPRALFAEQNVAISDKIECFGACSEAATSLLEMDSSTPAAAVISSYAKPLLEGCGTIKKGDLRVVAETKPVRFVTAFVNQELDSGLTNKIQAALLDLKSHSDVLTAMESRDGFVPMDVVVEVSAMPIVSTKKK